MKEGGNNYTGKDRRDFDKEVKRKAGVRNRLFGGQRAYVLPKEEGNSIIVAGVKKDRGVTLGLFATKHGAKPDMVDPERGEVFGTETVVSSSVGEVTTIYAEATRPVGSEELPHNPDLDADIRYLDQIRMGHEEGYRKSTAEDLQGMTDSLRNAEERRQ